MHPVIRVVAILGLLLGVLLATPVAKADGLYDRWSDDLTLAAGLGGGATLDGARDGGRPAGTWTAELRARFIDAAGPVLALSHAPGRGPNHVFLGVELRPFFPGLFLMDYSTGRGRLDLFLQSFGLELGAGFLLDGEGSVGFGVGFGVEVPLVVPRTLAQGVWLRLAARRIIAGPDMQSVAGADASHWVLLATLAVKVGATTGLPSWDRPRYR